MTWWNEPTALILVFGAFCTGIGSCIAIISSNIRMSRCHKIKCCCWECDRLVLSKEEQERELAIQTEQLESQRLQLNRSNSGQAQAPSTVPVPSATQAPPTSESVTNPSAPSSAPPPKN